MAARFAFFVEKESIEQIFGFTPAKDSLFSKHYNLAPGYQLPVIRKENGEYILTQVQLGPGKNSSSSAELDEGGTAKLISEKNDAEPVILPLSGFYIWKGDDENGQPFFVRMLNSAIMPVAAIYHHQKIPYVQIVTVPANTLIQPMSERMPLFLDKKTSETWIETPSDPESFLKKSQGIFSITDLSVLKVSKRVNDLTENEPSLIQPEPK
jgi:putative SOS response-associated peptidase YedK